LLERDIYLLDEIETSLDANSRQVLIDFIKQKSNTSFIIVSHNQDMIKLADEALLLCNGKIQQI
jgi:chromosome segregation ATPase